MIDARRMEVYTALYNWDLKEEEVTRPLILEETILDDILAKGPCFFFGDGASKMKQYYPEGGNVKYIEGIYPSASVMGALAEERHGRGKFEDIAYYEPFYLKGFHATTPKKKL